MHWEGDPGQLDGFKGRKLSMLSYSHTRPLPLCGIGSAELRSVRNTMSQHGNQPEARQNRQGVKTTEVLRQLRSVVYCTALLLLNDTRFRIS